VKSTMLSRVATSFRATSLGRSFATAAHPFAKTKPNFNGKLYDYVPSLYLVTSAQGKDVPDKVAADISAFANQYHNNPVVTDIQFRIDEIKENEDGTFELPTEASKAENAALVTSRLMPKAHPEAKAMIETLLMENTIKILPDLARSFEGLIDYQLKRIRVNVQSAQSLSADQLGAIEKKIATLLPAGHTGVYTNEVKPELLGGVVIYVDDTAMDFSVSTTLTKLSAELEA